MNDYSKYIAVSRYARYLPEFKRRETFAETVARLCDFWQKRFPDTFPREEIEDAINKLQVVPSMRSLMCSGPALERDEIAGYNCSYIAVDSPRSFDEALYVLMCGTGLGFSVERQHINQLPLIPDELHKVESTIKPRDSRIGWATGLRELLAALYTGSIPNWDFSNLRPKGARLKTFGGRSSGPAPLHDLFEFVVSTFVKAAGRKLNSIECHDIMCKIGDVVVAGGVRRSALISLSNLTDERMRNAKNGQWWQENGQRALANNSVAYTEKPDMNIFLKEWTTLVESGSGERGLFNRVGAQKQASINGRRDSAIQFGTNPCAEIILRPNGLCNLSEVVVRSGDTLKELKRKVRIATILGTFQSTLTNFRYLRSIWKTNAEEERLLGVSLTGIMDHELLAGKADRAFDLAGTLRELKQHAIDTNAEWAAKLGINPSAAITCVKPSGTVSQLVDSASGIHPRYSEYYVRTVRSSSDDSVGHFMQAAGVPNEPDVTNPNNTVFSFPMKAPSGAVMRNDMSAIDQLEHYLVYKNNWAEHTVSITVYVRAHEWLEVGAWVYKNFDDLIGVSFLPHSDHVYKQAPYQEITKEQYEELVPKMPILNWDVFTEDDDAGINYREFACVSGYCEI